MKKYTTQRKKKSITISAENENISVIEQNACGIDVGAESVFVCVPRDRDPNPIREFATFTADLRTMAEWLKKSGITKIVMESTGVYWIPVFEVLDEYKFDVKLANAHHVKNVPGRKTDVSDAEWLQRLHTYGLLNGSEKKVFNKSPYYFDMRTKLHSWAGVDLCEIPGINENTAAKILSEIGTDMTKWRSAKHFASWLAVCPGNKISGGKRLSGRTKPSKNRAREALGMAAQALTYSDSYLGAYYRRMRSKCGSPKANRAAAHKIGKIIYCMLKEGKEYKELGASVYEELHKERTLTNMENRARKLGYKLVPIAA